MFMWTGWFVDIHHSTKSAYCECIKFLERWNAYLHTARCWEQYCMPGISREHSTHLSLSADAVLSGLLEPRSVKVKSDVVTWSPWPRYTRSRRRILLPYSTGPNPYRQSLVEGRGYMFIEGGLPGGFGVIEYLSMERRGSGTAPGRLHKLWALMLPQNSPFRTYIFKHWVF